MTDKLERFKSFLDREETATDLVSKEYIKALSSLAELYGIEEDNLEMIDGVKLRDFIKVCMEEFSRQAPEAIDSNPMGNFYHEAIMRWFNSYGVDVRTILRLRKELGDTSEETKQYILQEWLKAKQKMFNENPAKENDENK